MEGTGGARRARAGCETQALAAAPAGRDRAWPGFETQRLDHPRQISHAIPPRHDPTQAQKPQNINDQISKPEILSGELHAKLLSGKQDEATHSNESVACVREPARKGRAWLRCPWVAAGPGWAVREGLAAVPVGGGGAWPGFEATRRAKLAARTTRGRAAAHGHIKQPGTHTTQPGPSSPAHTQPGTHTAHTAHTARGPKRRSASGPSRVSVAHRLSWMLRPGTASISSRV